jgi:hypothetical protein
VGRRKTAEPPTEVTEVVTEVPVEVSPETETNGPPTEEKRKPVASWSVRTDGTTRLELACWSNIY